MTVYGVCTGIILQPANCIIKELSFSRGANTGAVSVVWLRRTARAVFERIVCQRSRTIETAQRIGFNRCVPYTACTFQTDELHPPGNERPPFGLKWLEGKARGHKRWYLLTSDKVEYADIPLGLTRLFRLYRVAASAFKTDGSDRTVSERPSSTIRLKPTVCRRLKPVLCSRSKSFK